MTAHQTTTLIIRLLGVVWFLFLLSHVGALAIYLSGESGPKPAVGFVLGMELIQLAGCALLWLFPATIAAKLLPSTLSNTPRPPSTPLEWQTLGVISIGLWTLSQALSGVVYWLVFWSTASHSDIGPNLGPSQKANMLSTVAQLAIGFWLTFGGKGFAAMLFRARTAGLKLEQPD